MEKNKKKKKKKNHILSLDALPPPREPAPRAAAATFGGAAASDPVGGLNISSNMITFDDFDNLESDPCLQGLVTDADKKKPNTQDNNNNNDSGGSKRKQPDVAQEDDDDDDNVMLVSLKKKKRRLSPPPSSKPVPSKTEENTVLAKASTKKTPATAAKPQQRPVVKATARASSNKRKQTVATSKASNKKKAAPRKKVAVTKQPTRTSQNEHSRLDSIRAPSPTASHVPAPELVCEEEDLLGDIQGVTQLESDMLKRVHRYIWRAEEEALLEGLDDDIFLAEELQMLQQMGEKIRTAAKEYWKDGGCVISAWDPRDRIPDEVVQTEREWDANDARENVIKQMELFRDFQHTLKEHRKKNKTIVLDVDNMGNDELIVRKELPKYVGSTGELLWTQEQLSKALTSKLRQDGVVDTMRVTLNDKKDDPYTVVVEICGQEEVVNRVKRCFVGIIRAKQLHYLAIKHARPPTQDTELTKKGHTRAVARTLHLYREFESRYQKMPGLEFGGIHHKAVIGSMWRAHKLEGFGAVCNGACQCFVHLDKLTSTVIDDHMKKKTKKKTLDHAEQIRPAVIGFASRFAPKFMSLLRKEFPHELNEELFGRLVRMWPKHIQQQRFGTTCKEGCSCLEGWTSVFKKGRLEKAAQPVTETTGEPSRPDMTVRRSSSVGSRTVAASAPGQRFYEIVFDARKPLGFFAVTKKRGKTSVVKILSVNPRGAATDPRLFPETIISHASAAGSSDWHVLVSHDDLKILYENCKRSFSKIRIRFINTDVKAFGTTNRAKDGNWSSNMAWKGKTNTEGWAGGATVSSAVAPTKASTADPAVRASFRDHAAHVTDASLASTEPVKKNLPGSASVPQSRRQAPPHQNKRSSMTQYGENVSGSSMPTVENQSVRPARPEMPSASERRDVHPPASGFPGTQEKWLERREPNHRGLPRPKPILRDVAPKKPQKEKDSLFRNLAGRPKKKTDTTIDWNKHQLEDIRLFWPDGRYSILSTEPEQRDNVVASKVKPRKPSNLEKDGTSNTALLAAIKMKSCVEVYKNLIAGASTRPENVDLRDDKNYPELVAKRLRASRENNYKSSPSDEAKRHLDDARMKITLLKMFEKLRVVAGNSMAYKRWGRYEIRIDRIEDLEIEDAAEVEPGDKFICRVSIKGQNMGNTAPMDFAKEVTYIDGSGSHSRYAFHYNPTLSRDSTLVLTLQRADKMNFFNNKQIEKTGLETLDLAQEKIELMNLANAAATDAKGGDFPVDITPTKFVKSARAVVLVQHMVALSTGRIEKERKRWQHELYEILNDISQFNEDPSRESRGLQKFDVNLANPVNPHITLLHAAVYLDDVRAVQKLVSMGANADIESPQGLTPRKLALYLFSEKKASKQILEILGIKPEEYEDKVEDSDETANENATQAGPHSKSVNESRRDGSIDQFSPSTVDAYSQKPAPVNSSRGTTARHTEASRPPERFQVKRESELLGKRDRGTEETSPQNRKMAKRESFRRELPDMSIEHILSGKKRCHFYRGRKGSCTRGRSCPFAHLEIVDPNGSYQQYIRPQYNRDDLRIQKGAEQDGQLCCTAIYWNREKNVYVQAMGGNTIGKNVHGIYWYRNEGEAVEAIELVLAIYQNQRIESQQKSGKHAAIKFTPAQSADTRRASNSTSRTPEDHLPARAETSKPQGEAPLVDDAEAVAFKKLVKNPNHSATYACLVRRNGKGAPLPKDAWTVRTSPRDATLANASFTPWIAENLPATKTFSSGRHGNAIHEGGVWYHRELNAAKASAFLEFLKYLRDLGILHSLEESIDMRRLPYSSTRS